MIFRILSRLDHAQKTRRFQWIASAAVLFLVIGGYAAILVAGNAPAGEAAAEAIDRAPSTEPLSWIEAGPIGSLSRITDTLLTQASTTQGAVTLGTAFSAVALAALIIIWLGISLSYLGLLVLGWGVAWPLMSIDATRTLGQLLMGLVPLGLAFLTLIQAARVGLYGSNPIIAIARNVLNEAVRMKVSIVFIVILLLLMAFIPNSLTEDQPLRYRVQQWLSYGLGFSYAILALLTVFLSVATVAFEQRDKIIWQTATKPVASWQYVFGKWLGVMVLNLVLLSVSATGVYIFTEYLRYQPADGESAYYVDLRGASTRGGEHRPSLDRRLLEQHVLVARVAIEPEPREPTDVRLDLRVDRARNQAESFTPEDERKLRSTMVNEWSELIETVVNARLEEKAELGHAFKPTQALIAKTRSDVIKQVEAAYRAIQPGGSEEYVFDTRDVFQRWSRRRDRMLEPVLREVDRRLGSGQVSPEERERVVDRVLNEFVRDGRLPPVPELTLRYTIHAGTNEPTQIYRLYFFINGTPYPLTTSGRPSPTEVALKAAQTISFPIALIDEPGVLVLGVGSDPSNRRTLSFPPDGLSVLYSVGGYETNFLRVIAVMWIKLGFIAAVGIAMATSLSFSVASLVTLGVLFMAESASFLSTSLEYYSVKDLEGSIIWFKVLIRAVSLPIAWMFQVYADLRPTERLVDGRLVSWSSLSMAIAVIGAWTAVVLAIGLAIFRKRELAIYSGN